MTWRWDRIVVLGNVLMVCLTIAANGNEPERVLLDRCVIVTDGEQPSFVRYGVEELAGYLRELTGREVPVVASADRAQPVRILVGSHAVRDVLADGLPAEGLGDEGYCVKVVVQGGVTYVVVAGTAPSGTKVALGILMKAIQAEGQSAYVPASLCVTGKPALAKRGLHFNGWAFHYPYSFRSWREKDWCSYLDLLAYQGVNLFYLWPFIEIMPVPLSPEDRAYLEECARVVDYAQHKHGMEVWIMQCLRSTSTAWKSGSCSAPTGWPRTGAAWPIPGCGRTGARRRRI